MTCGRRRADAAVADLDFDHALQPGPAAVGSTGRPGIAPARGDGPPAAPNRDVGHTLLKSLGVIGTVLLAVLGVIGSVLDGLVTVIYHAVWIGIGVGGVILGVSTGIGLLFLAPVIALAVLILYWTTGWMLFFD